MAVGGLGAGDHEADDGGNAGGNDEVLVVIDGLTSQAGALLNGKVGMVVGEAKESRLLVQIAAVQPSAEGHWEDTREAGKVVSVLRGKLVPLAAPPSAFQYSMTPRVSHDTSTSLAALSLIWTTGAVWMFSTLIAVPDASDAASNSRIGGEFASATASSGLLRDWPPEPPIHSHAPGTNSRVAHVIMSKESTSNTLNALSPAVVASNEPSGVAAKPAIGARCARKCFTNSMPTCIFFQNLTWPSREPVIIKSDAVHTMCVT